MGYERQDRVTAGLQKAASDGLWKSACGMTWRKPDHGGRLKIILATSGRH